MTKFIYSHPVLSNPDFSVVDGLKESKDGKKYN